MRKKCALLTISHNEKFMFPIWWKYYSQHFDCDDIYVLDHVSTDGHLDGYPCNVWQIKRPVEPQFEHGFLLHSVMKACRELLKEYQYFLFVETDEFMIPHPDVHGTLLEFIHHFNKECVRANGFEVSQSPEEPDLDFSKPLLAQRSKWMWNEAYCKTLISCMPITWNMGFHKVVGNSHPQPRIDENWVLAHLCFIDRALCLKRWQNRPLDAHNTYVGQEEHVRSQVHGKYIGEGTQAIPEWAKRVL